MNSSSDLPSAALEHLFVRRRGSDGWRTTAKTFGEATMALLMRRASCILTPDASWQGLTGPILRTIKRDLSLEPVAARSVTMTPDFVNRVYDGRMTHPRTDEDSKQLSLAAEFMSLGPSLLVMFREVRGSMEGRTDLQNSLSYSKGPSRHGSMQSGRLRGLSSLSDRCFCLVHSADDGEGILHELEVLLSETTVSGCLHGHNDALAIDNLALLHDEFPAVAQSGPMSFVFRGLQRALIAAASSGLQLDAEQRLGIAIVGELRALDRQVCGGRHAIEAAWQCLQGLAPRLQALSSSIEPPLREPVLRWAEFCWTPATTIRAASDVSKAMANAHLLWTPWDCHRLRVIAQHHSSCAQPSS